MSRAFLGSVVVMAVCLGSLTAETVRGTIKSVEAERATLTVVAGKTAREFKVTNDTKLTDIAGQPVPRRLEDVRFRAGAAVIVTTQEKDGKEAVTEVRLARPERKR